MTLSSRAPAGTVYVVKRPHAPGKTDGPPVFLTRRGGEIRIGPFTPNVADARRWGDRAAVWRFVKLRRGSPGQAGPLDDHWAIDRIPK